MSKREFLMRLREALENDLSGVIVQDNLNYYTQYIEEEMARGRGEEEVVCSLGDPWIIARTVIDTAGLNNGQVGMHEEPVYNQGGADNKQGSKIRAYGIDSLWRKIGLIVIIIGAVLLVFSIITGLIRILAPIVVPIVIVYLVLRKIKNKN